MATAAAIDRIVHHSVILEFDLPSYRTSEAQGRQLQERQLHRTPTGQSNWCKAARVIALTNPSNALAHLYKGKGHYELGEYDKAIAHFDEAMGLDSESDEEIFFLLTDPHEERELALRMKRGQGLSDAGRRSGIRLRGGTTESQMEEVPVSLMRS